MKKLALAGISFLALCGAAEAASFNANWTVTNSSFTNTVGGSNVTSGSTGQDASLSWGSPATANGQSGYIWDGQNGSILLTPDVEASFVYGQFTHINQPIFSGTSITGTDLNFTLSLFGQDNPVTLDILHNETLNTGPGCCNDIVSQLSTVLLDYLNESGEAVGIVSILPFVFQTVENGNTTYSFGGKMLFKETFTPPPVPLPAPLLLLLSALAGLLGLGRWRNRVNRAGLPT